MFIGSIEAKEKGYGIYPQIIRDMLDYLGSHDFTQMTDGKYAIKDGIFFTVQRYKTKNIDECAPENHKKYIDIQFMAEGEEYLGWCPFSPDLTASGEYDAEKDVTFYKELVPDSNIILLPGSFAVLYPEDVHRPCVSVDDDSAPVTKVVMKIPVELVK